MLENHTDPHRDRRPDCSRQLRVAGVNPLCQELLPVVEYISIRAAAKAVKFSIVKPDYRYSRDS
jgi:hypothetical protein